MPDKIPPTALGQNQNLINQIRIEKVEPLGKPPGFYKSIILDVLGVIFAFLTGYAYSRFLGGIWSLLVPVSAFLAFIMVLAIEALLEEKITRRIGTIIIEVVALLAPFYAFDAWILVVCAAIAIIFLLVGYLQCRSELDHGTTIRFFRSTHGTIAKAVTAAILIAIILYLPAARAGAIFVGEPEFTGFFDWAAGILSGFYPAVSLTGSFGEFAQSLAKEELATNATFKLMSPDEQDAAVSAAAVQVGDSLSKSLGITVSASSSTSDVVYNIIQNMLQGWRNKFSVWFAAGWGFALFLILRSVGVVVVWIGQFLTMVVYELLLSAGAIRIMEEPRTKEIIEF